MNVAGRAQWLVTAIIAGALYAIVGIVTGALAGGAASPQARLLWRWSAFALSGVVFVAHIVREHVRSHHPARITAWHVAVGAAIGGLGLALAANLHDLGSAAGYRPRMIIALVAWPLLTGVPAFVAALLVAAVWGARRRST